METAFKNFLKRIGLLPFVLTIKQIFSLVGIINIIDSFRFFFFNNCLTNFPNHFMRQLYLRYFLNVKIGDNSFIHMGCRFDGKISIGNNTVIGRKCILNGEITIRNNVSITAETYIFTSSHYANSSSFECFYKPVVINDYAWVGARAMILPGVSIGKGAILGAASTATKNIPEYTIYAGAPAKEIGKRSTELNYTIVYSPFFQ